MEKLTLEAKKRSDISPKNLRKNKTVPAVFYGHKKESIALEINEIDFIKLYRASGRSTIITLSIEGKEENALVHAIQYHPVTSKILSIDFYAIRMDEEITAEVPVKLIGVSEAVKTLGGILFSTKNKVNVKCLPANLPHEIELDISIMKATGDAIHIKDLAKIDKVEFTDSEDDMIVSVMAPRKVEDIEAEEKAAEGAPEEKETASVSEEKKAERDESKEGGEKK